MGVKMNFRIITKNHGTDSKIGSTLKIDFRAVGTHESHPTAWELSLLESSFTMSYHNIVVLEITY